ncbi:hypothetical protein OUZ56_007493 [Daphnia magna]|uniref:Uncharacterized protein n=1 Tax=Daphnia magna TaxID=35525 RepID=A0ABR0AA52_9CRUS|nr:hypothetical protein OUZ56_007493 [Daphnia magna]
MGDDGSDDEVGRQEGEKSKREVEEAYNSIVHKYRFFVFLLSVFSVRDFVLTSRSFRRDCRPKKKTNRKGPEDCDDVVRKKKKKRGASKTVG